MSFVMNAVLGSFALYDTTYPSSATLTLYDVYGPTGISSDGNLGSSFLLAM